MKTIRIFLLMALLTVMAFAFAGCGEDKNALEDGTYTVDVTTDSNMFHLNEVCEGKGLLTSKDGEMTVHMTLNSKKIVNVFPGTKEEAQADGAELIQPVTDTVTYDDGITEEVYGFDIPVPALDEEFTVAIIGTHDNWYEHTMTVSNPVEGDQIPGIGKAEEKDQKTDLKPSDKSLEELEDGEYQAIVDKDGGTGRADVESPAKLVVKDGKATLTLVWSSPNFDYMKVDGEKYEPVNEEGNSTFEIPVTKLNEGFDVIADTTAMSQPHEIDYTLTVSVAE